MIHVDIREKRFGDTRILSHVAFEVAAGETVAVLGPSGIGKTTLLRIVAGIDPEFEGTVAAPERRAIVFQEPTLLRWRSALRNLTLIHPDLSEADARAILAKVGLGDRADAFPMQLSLGQQRRLALARAVAGQPEMLVLDEPFVSLDPATADAMLDLTATLLTEVRPATLFVTHDRTEADRLQARVIELRGRPATLAPHLVQNGRLP
ncbi:Aliphatic sulfonates import ATP-binding protein SsuB [Roseivivax jejudonensis]|uniref:Aliphatic sulfonates import ATP-binding protein SsuB n=1 Tax=Roseivivax jejudonensis TaxID=1529041 RepID=A0A1X6ZNQ7_9RHOB|nr:ATP-binding cassette domain-containing protein [Roseivivax jejudonensis]SLN57133.1 Aliphatic sulfonates import ATP-binding protein SsuB [Roseivivax jejudonensis]